MGSCHKVRHPSQAVAEIALRHAQESCRRRGSKLPTGTYWCPVCRSWHLTSKSPSRRAPWQRKGQRERASGTAADAKA